MLVDPSAEMKWASEIGYYEIVLLISKSVCSSDYKISQLIIKVGLQGHPTGLIQSSVSENVLKANFEAVSSCLKIQ